MTKRDFNIAATVSINADAVADTHTFRDLTQQGLTLEGVANTIDQATRSMADHYHELALSIERGHRKKRGTKFTPVGVIGTQMFVSADEADLETIRCARAEFNKHVEDELAWLRSEKGWDKTKLPNACDSAIRKILAAWDNGFSLETLPTCSKIASANSKFKKEKEAAEEAAILQSNGMVMPGTEQAGDVKVISELEPLVKKLKEALEADPVHAQGLIAGTMRKADNIIAYVAKQAVEGAMKEQKEKETA